MTGKANLFVCMVKGCPSDALSLTLSGIKGNAQMSKKCRKCGRRWVMGNTGSKWKSC